MTEKEIEKHITDAMDRQKRIVKNYMDRGFPREKVDKEVDLFYILKNRLDKYYRAQLEQNMR